MKTSDDFSPQAEGKTWFVYLIFLLWALVVVFRFHIKPEFASILIFYALLLLNTFFSVRIFATITPRGHAGQTFWDLLLGLCIAFLPLSFASPMHFVFLTLFLFVIATLKYIFLIPVVGFSKLLFEKIRIDTLGILLCALCLAGILFGFAYWSLNLFAFVFFLANVYVIWHKPLYRLEHHIEHLFEEILKK
jgi:hypothetical protein